MGIVIILTADRLDLHQFGIALRLQARALFIGLSLGQGGFGAVNRGVISRRIDLVQQLTGFDVTAFGKVALEDDTTDLGTHFGNAAGCGTTGKLGGQLEWGGFQGDDIDSRGWHGTRGRLLCFTATAEQGTRQQGNTDGTRENIFMHRNQNLCLLTGYLSFEL